MVPSTASHPTSLASSVLTCALLALLASGCSSSSESGDAGPRRDLQSVLDALGAELGPDGSVTSTDGPREGGAFDLAPGSDGPQGDFWQQGLAPGVNWGIAAHYPLDKGIEASPYVVAAEDFESGAVAIATQEDRYKNNIQVQTSEVHTGTYAGVKRWTQGEASTVARVTFPPSLHGKDARPAYFVRVCYNFDKSFHPGGDASKGVGVKGFGVAIKGNTNTPCDGTNWYNAQVQFVGWGPSAKPDANNKYLWVGHNYSYNPDPHGAVATEGTKKVTSAYRLSVYPSPHRYIKFDSWNCYEVGLYLNTPGKNDGEARYWVNGVLESRITNVRYRDTPTLFPTHANLNMYRTTTNFPQTMVRYVDNIVIARRYIGPVKR